MNFKPKIKSNYSWLKLLMLTLALMFSITFFNPLEVHASYATMTENRLTSVCITFTETKK